MKLVEFKGRWANVGEVRFLPEAPSGGLDVVYYLQVKQALPEARCEPVCTLVIDLAKRPEELLAAMNDTTRYEVRRAEQKDALVYASTSSPSPGEIARFLEFYGSFARRRGLAPAGGRALRAYASSGCLDLSWVTDAAGAVLGWHAHFVDGGRARLLLSATLRDAAADKEREKLLGRANRWHHWRDLLRFRDAGLREFDFGGILPGKGDPEQESIRAFKEKFGGAREDGFNCELPLTLRGRLYLLAKRLKGS